MSEIKLDLAAPCDDCVHVRVCAIKANLESSKAILTIPVLLPELTPRYMTGPLFVDCAEQLSPDAMKPKRGRPAKATRSSKPFSPVDQLYARTEALGEPEPVPDDETFEQKRHRLAREKADTTWRQLHPGEPDMRVHA